MYKERLYTVEIRPETAIVHPEAEYILTVPGKTITIKPGMLYISVTSGESLALVRVCNLPYVPFPIELGVFRQLFPISDAIRGDSTVGDRGGNLLELLHSDEYAVPKILWNEFCSWP